MASGKQTGSRVALPFLGGAARHESLTLGWFGLGLAMLVLIGVVSALSFRLAEQAALQEEQARKLLTNTRQLLLELGNAESSQRGYLLTGRSSFLEPYRAARASIAGPLSTLYLLTGDDPAQQQRLRSLTAAIREILNEFDESIAVMGRGESEGANAGMLTQRGERAMETIRATLLEIQDTERRLVDQRASDRRSKLRSGFLVTLGGAFLALMSLAISQVILRRGIARRNEALRLSAQEVGAVTARLLTAQDEERKRISRELHDDLNQKLALLSFDIGGLIEAAAGPDGGGTARLQALQHRVIQLSDDVRSIAHRLHSSILEDLGLSVALRALCEEFSEREGIPVTFQADEASGEVPVEIATCLYRVAQESLHNVSKHAHARHVTVTLDGSAAAASLSIEDSGQGFDPHALKRRGGLGIVSMEERVRLIHGQFSVTSQPGHGTRVAVSVPLPGVA